MIKFSTLRPFSGSSCTRRLPTTIPTDAFSVCSTGDAPVTWTVSARLPSLQGDFDAGRGLDVDFDLIPHVALKPGQLDLEAVGAGHEIQEPVHAIVPAHAFAAFVGRGVHQNDGGAWNDLFLIIFHHRDQRPVEALAQCRDANQGQPNENNAARVHPEWRLNMGPPQ